MLPRRQTFLSFNMIHQVLAEIVEAAGMMAAFTHLQLPCNVRLVEGTPDPQADTRSYSSTKIHTDVWNGEPVSSILFNIPVLGDTDAVDLRFYEPHAFPKNLRVSLSDYTLGTDVAANVDEYPTAFEMRNMYISDALSLHKTLKRRSRLRLSLDFRAIARELLSDETADCSTSHAIYVTPEQWRACGSTIILGSGESVDAFQRRQAGQTVAHESLSLIDIDDFSEERARELRRRRRHAPIADNARNGHAGSRAVALAAMCNAALQSSARQVKTASRRISRARQRFKVARATRERSARANQVSASRMCSAM